MFGNLYEKTKPQENFIAPVYQAMALNMYQQHVSAEYGYLDAMRSDTENSNNYFASAEDGIVPLATVQNEQISGVKDDNTVFDFIRARLPATYKPQNGTRTYLFALTRISRRRSSAMTLPTILSSILLPCGLFPRGMTARTR